MRNKDVERLSSKWEVWEGQTAGQVRRRTGLETKSPNELYSRARQEKGDETDSEGVKD